MKLVVTEFVSLDGVMEDPGWTFQFNSDEQQKYKLDELSASDALLLGRVTYEGFAAAWPAMKDEAGFGERMNGLPKYVATTTLNDLAWNNSSRLEGDVAQTVAKLKEQPGGDLVVHGSAALVQYLMQHDLVDEYHLMTFPIVLGSGKRLFGEGGPGKTLKLVEARALASGVVILTYRPA